MLTPELVAILRHGFARHDYTVAGVLDLIGPQAQAALGRNSSLPGARALAGRDDPLAILTLLWPLQRPVARGDLERALPRAVDGLIDVGVLHGDDQLRAAVDIRPYATEDDDFWIVSDLTPGLDTVIRPMRTDFVLGVSSASSTLAQLTPRRPVARALDLGTGSGVQTLHLARHAEQIVATDLNPRALDLARDTLALNGIEADLRLGSLYEPVPGERFDLITTNPPYVLSPPTDDRLTYREGDHVADGLVADVVRGAGDHLAADGIAEVLANWAHVRGQGWADRLRSWIPAGCDAHVVQREVMDPYAYVELWLADAGLTGSPDYPERYAAWLDYFAGLQIEAVGMGWIVLHRSSGSDPRLRLEDWPHAVEQPIGPAFEAGFAALDLDRQLTDDDVLGARWQLAADVIQETLGPPGAADPEVVILRQQRGFRRAEQVDTATAAVLGACDGDLPLRALIDAVAGLLDLDPGALRLDLLPRIRQFALDGFLTPSAPTGAPL